MRNERHQFFQFGFCVWIEVMFKLKLVVSFEKRPAVYQAF